MPSGDQRIQRGNCEARRAAKDKDHKALVTLRHIKQFAIELTETHDTPRAEAETPSYFYHSPAFTSFLILRLIRSRFSALMWEI